MAVDNYETTEKQSVDELIDGAKQNSGLFIIGASAPIEHYTIEELKELAEKVSSEGFMITMRAEHSNFYQGVLISLIKRENVNEKYSQYL